MADLPLYPDAEQLLRGRLTGLADHDPGASTPPDLEKKVPVLAVQRVGGPDDGRTDVSRMVVDAYAATAGAAWLLARRAQQRLLSGPARIPGAGIIDRITTEVGPQQIPHDNPAVRCVRATYRVSARRLSS